MSDSPVEYISSEDYEGRYGRISGRPCDCCAFGPNTLGNKCELPKNMSCIGGLFISDAQKKVLAQLGYGETPSVIKQLPWPTTKTATEASHASAILEVYARMFPGQDSDPVTCAQDLMTALMHFIAVELPEEDTRDIETKVHDVMELAFGHFCVEQEGAYDAEEV